jgi:hypothetical protein
MHADDQFDRSHRDDEARYFHASGTVEIELPVGDASNFSRADVELIQRSYEQKAAGLLPNIITKVRSEALKGLGRKERSDENIEVREPNKRGPVAPGRSASPNGGNSSARSNMKSPPKGQSVRAFLMADD